MLIRFFDMFAGVGGFRAGLERAGGFECVGHCEIDKHADAAYRAIHSIKENEVFYEDATKINTDTLPEFDLLCAGFPYVENSHPAIIRPETFDLVQSEMKKRTSVRRQVNNNSPFAARIICGQCGGFYGSKVWHSTDQYRTAIWQCNRKYKNGTFCDTPHIRQETLQLAFVEAFNRILGNKDRYVSHFEELLPLLADTAPLEAKLETVTNECSKVGEQLRLCIEENARRVQNQEEYERRYNELAERFAGLNNQMSDIAGEILAQSVRKEKIRRFLDELRKAENLVTEFDENLWTAAVDTVTVESDKELTVTFRDGTKIPVAIPEQK